MRQSWENLLFYSDRWVGPNDSLIDSQDFFLSKRGASDSFAELQAFLEGLKGEASKVKEEDKLVCRFPARTAWVRSHLPHIPIPETKCSEFENWLAISKPAGISIIFSSYFVNNPSSMMGHTFLRIKRSDANASPLLDQSVNFAATPTHEIPLLYNIDGLTGGFPGNFSMLPYYIKVQEYANAESRDLWEYDLSLNETETRLVLASLWEVAPRRIDYYFFDENCSAVLLYLIQNARRDLHLSRHLGSWVHPSDTLRYLMDEPGLVKDIIYRPSSRSRYLAEIERLSEDERDLVKELVRAKTLQLKGYEQRSEESQARVLDAVIAFIEFDESLYGAKKVVKHVQLYDETLLRRSKLAASPLTDFAKPEIEAPHLGHRGRRLGFALGQYKDRGELQLEYRPGQHDLLSPAIGYPPELSIQLGKTRLNFEEERTARVRSFEVFHIQSFNPSRSGRLPWSWQLQLNYENTEQKRVQILGSLGQSFTLGSRENFAFLFYDQRFKTEEGELYACPGASSGVRFSLYRKLVSFSQVSVERCYGKTTDIWKGRWSQELRYSLEEDFELFFEGRRYEDARELTLGFYRYY